MNSSTGSAASIQAADATEAGIMSSAQSIKLNDITPRASMAGAELRAITFEIVSGTPNSVDENPDG